MNFVRWLLETAQIPTIAAVCTSTILILRFIVDLKKSAADRQKEIREELRKQALRDLDFDKHREELHNLKVEFEAFRSQMQQDMLRLSNLIIDSLRFQRLRDKEP